MLQDLACLSSPCYSYLANYKIQHALYKWWDNYTPPENDCVRIPGLCVWTASSLVTLVTRVAGVAEVFLIGAGTIFINPKTGLKEVFIETPKNMLRVIHIPFMFFGGTILTLADPKYFTIFTLESAKANLEHARNKTIGTKKHAIDVGCTDGMAKRKFMEYQEKFRNIHGRQTWKLKFY
jgi:hypothetical protein